MNFQEFIEAISTLGTLGFALVAVFAFLTERVVPKARLDEKERDRQEAMALARAAIASNERLADALEADERARRRR